MQYNIDQITLPHGMIPETGDVLEITRKKQDREPLPPFNIVGNGMSNRNGQSLDLLEVCLQLNMSEMRLLQFFRDAFTRSLINQEANPNKVEPLKWPEFDKYLATALRKNYSHLEYMEVLARIKRGVYLINPNMLIPTRNFTEISAEWEQYKGSNDAIHV